jgi:hypothetical protein
LNSYRDVFLMHAAIGDLDEVAEYADMLGELAREASENGEEEEGDEVL